MIIQPAVPVIPSASRAYKMALRGHIAVAVGLLVATAIMLSDGPELAIRVALGLSGAIWMGSEFSSLYAGLCATDYKVERPVARFSALAFGASVLGGFIVVYQLVWRSIAQGNVQALEGSGPRLFGGENYAAAAPAGEGWTVLAIAVALHIVATGVLTAALPRSQRPVGPASALRTLGALGAIIAVHQGLPIALALAGFALGGGAFWAQRTLHSPDVPA